MTRVQSGRGARGEKGHAPNRPLLALQRQSLDHDRLFVRALPARKQRAQMARGAQGRAMIRILTGHCLDRLRIRARAPLLAEVV